MAMTAFGVSSTSNGFSTPTKPMKANFHHVAVGKLKPFAEAQAARTEVMNVHIARAAVTRELEMMMLDVPQAVTHVGAP
jgi:hypothetical protein